MDIKYPCRMSVYRLEGEKAHPHMDLEFKEGTSVASMVKVLLLFRGGRAPGFGASLTDATGRNIPPSGEPDVLERPSLRAALERLLECAELNQDDLEPETIAAIDAAQSALAAEASPT